MQDYIPREIDINAQISDIIVKQYDHLSRYLHVQIVDADLNNNGTKKPSSNPEPLNLIGCQARIYVDLDNGNCAYIDGEVADGEEGIITFLLPNSVTQTAGKYQAEIWIYNPEEESQISTKPFTLLVSKSIRNDEAIEATEQFSALDNALRTVSNLDARINNLAAMADTGEIPAGTIESEVIDARCGYESGDYSSLHDAIAAAMNIGRNIDFINIIKYGAISGESYDSTNAFVSAFASSAPIYIPQGEYYIKQDKSITVASNKIVYFANNAKIIFTTITEDSYPANTPFDITGASNVTFYNADIEGSALPSSRSIEGANAFVYVRNKSENIRFLGHTHIKNAPRAGIMITSGTNGVFIEDILVEYCNADGIYMKGTKNVHIENAEISHNGDDGISMHNTFYGTETGIANEDENTATCENIYIGNAYVHDYSPNVDVSNPAMLFGGCWDVTVNNLTVENHNAPFRTKVGFDGGKEVNYGYTVSINNIKVINGTLPSITLYDVAGLTDRENYRAVMHIGTMYFQDLHNGSAHWGNGNAQDYETLGELYIDNLITNAAYNTSDNTFNQSFQLQLSSMLKVEINNFNAMDVWLDLRGQTVMEPAISIDKCACQRIILYANTTLQIGEYRPTYVNGNAIHMLNGSKLYAQTIICNNAGMVEDSQQAAATIYLVGNANLVCNEIRIRFPYERSNPMFYRGSAKRLVANTITIIHQNDVSRTVSWGLGEDDSRNIARVRTINETEYDT